MYSALFLLASIGQVAFSGPDAVDVGESVTVKVTGLPEPDLSKPLGESFAWLQDVRVEASSPEGSECVVESSIGLNIAPLSWRLELTFTPEVAGTYVIVYAYFGEQRQLQTYRVQVGQAPQPPPDPTPPPPSNISRAILIYESEETTAEWGTMVTQIRDQKLPVAILDKDTVNEHDQPLPELQAASEAISNGLPVLVGLTGEGVVSVTDRPETAREVAETLKKWGLE